MNWIIFALAIAPVWLALSLLVAYLIGGAVRLRDEHAPVQREGRRAA